MVAVEMINTLCPEEVRHASRNADSAYLFCIARDGKKGTLSQHFMTHVVPPLPCASNSTVGLHYGCGKSVDCGTASLICKSLERYRYTLGIGSEHSSLHSTTEISRYERGAVSATVQQSCATPAVETLAVEDPESS